MIVHAYRNLNDKINELEEKYRDKPCKLPAKEIFKFKKFSLLLRIVLLHMDGKLVMMMKNFVYGIIDVVGFVYLQLIFH